RLAEFLGQLPQLPGRLLAGLLGLRQGAGLELVCRLPGRLLGLPGLLRRPRLLPLLLADIAGQLARPAGDLLLLTGQLLGRAPGGRVGLAGQLLLGLRDLFLQLALLLSELTRLLRLLPGRQPLRPGGRLVAERPLRLGTLLLGQLAREVL